MNQELSHKIEEQDALEAGEAQKAAATLIQAIKKSPGGVSMPKQDLDLVATAKLVSDWESRSPCARAEAAGGIKIKIEDNRIILFSDSRYAERIFGDFLQYLEDNF